MDITKLEVKDHWEWKFYPLISLKYMSLMAFIEQRFFEIDFFNGFLWAELELSGYKSMVTIGIHKIYFSFGPGIRYD